MKTLALLCSLALTAAPALAQGAFLGVNLDPNTSKYGASITEVQEPSAASLMGLQVGDLVLQVADQEILSAEDLVRSMQRQLPGDIVTLRIERAGAELELMGVLGRRPGDRAAAPQVLVWPDARLQGIAPSPSWDMEELDLRMDETMRRLEELQGQWPELEQRWQELPAMPELPPLPPLPEMPEMGQLQFRVLPDGSFETAPRVDENTSIELRYPADTPAEERERLIKEAIETYGEGVEVRFEGQGRSVSIQRSHQSSSSNSSRGAAPRPKAPQAPDAPLPPRERMRDF
ncbi:MAG: PDZ domain-containing protein [Planctomycetota bacterium]|jgi:hypothetical protein